MKCANCDAGALFVYQITADREILYCNKHLPRFLDARRRAGNIKTTDEFAANRTSALQAVSSNNTEEPKKTRKRTKKAAENNEGNS